MDINEEKILLLDKLIVNERKSRIWTVISVGLFILMAILIIIISVNLSKTKGKLTVSEQRLAFLRDSIQNVKDSIAEINVTLERSSGNFDSLKNVNDTLTVLLNTTQKQVIQNNPGEANARIKELYKEAFPNQKNDASRNITDAIVQTNQINESKPKMIIYIQYMPDYKDLTTKIISELKREKIRVERPEEIVTTTFDPVVKYFHGPDKGEAERITKILNDLNIAGIKKKFVTQLVNLKSPLHQIEVWIGDYRKHNYDINVQQYRQSAIKKD